MKKIFIVFSILVAYVFANEVTVSILPQKYFVEKIAQDKVHVNVMVKPGSSPATYEPKTSQMRMLSKSLAYFSIGVPFEKSWLDKFKNANKQMFVVDTTKGIQKIKMQEHSHDEHNDHDEHDNHEKHDDHDDHDDHANHEKHDDHDDHDDHANHEKHDDHDEQHEHANHDEHDEHDHSGLDPHVWLDPILVKTQAKNIYEALIRVDSKNKDFYTKNYKNFLIELDVLNTKIKNILAPYHDKAFMVFHPSWGYFSKRYDLEQISIEVQGKEPKPAQLIELINEAKKHNIKIVFVSPQFSQNGAKTISKSINANVATINPLSVKWDENLIKVANEIAKTYK